MNVNQNQEEQEPLIMMSDMNLNLGLASGASELVLDASGIRLSSGYGLQEDERRLR